MHANPFEAPRVVPRGESTAKARLTGFEQEVADLERHALYGKHELPPVLERRAERIKAQFPEKDPEPMDYYIGAAWHELANVHRSAFLATIELAGKNEALTPGKVAEAYAAFPDRAQLESTEDRALARYRSATSVHWNTPRADRRDADVLRIDMEDRIATRRLEGEERALRRSDLLEKLRAVIESIPSDGRQSELKLMYLFRSWMLEKGLGDVMSVEHGLPREDMSDEKVDVRFILGTLHVPLQMKTEVKADAYRAEHYDRVRQKASAATEHTDTVLVTIDVRDLRDCYRLAHEELAGADKAKATRLKKSIIESIASSLPPEQAAMLQLLVKDGKKEAKKPPERITKDFILRNSGVPQLTKLGLLEGGITPATLAKAKAVLQENLPALAKILNRESYVNPSPDDVQKLKMALGGQM